MRPLFGIISALASLAGAGTRDFFRSTAKDDEDRRRRSRLSSPRRGWSPPTRSYYFRSFSSQEEREKRMAVLSAYFAKLREKRRGALERVAQACAEGNAHAARAWFAKLASHRHAHPSTLRKAERVLARARLS